MAEALKEAQKAFNKGEVPVGCVAVESDTIISRAGNLREKDPTGHAEMIVLRDTGAVIGNRVLDGITIYVTLEPCPMCMSAIMIARVGRLVFGASDPKLGAVYSRWNLPNDPSFGHSIRIASGILESECMDILNRFFEVARKR